MPSRTIIRGSFWCEEIARFKKVIFLNVFKVLDDFIFTYVHVHLMQTHTTAQKFGKIKIFNVKDF